MKTILYFVVLCSLIFTARASETIGVKIEKLEYLIQLPEPFNKIKIGAEISSGNNNLARIYVKGRSININIKDEHLSLYNNADLSSIKIYEGDISNNIIAKDGKFEERTINDFSLCLEYGEHKKGVRINKEGWYRNSLRILFKKTGEYELINNQVSEQKIPDGICIQ